jgi:hypothetical protein
LTGFGGLDWVRGPLLLGRSLLMGGLGWGKWVRRREAKGSKEGRVLEGQEEGECVEHLLYIRGQAVGGSYG